MFSHCVGDSFTPNKLLNKETKWLANKIITTTFGEEGIWIYNCYKILLLKSSFLPQQKLRDLQRNRNVSHIQKKSTIEIVSECPQMSLISDLADKNFKAAIVSMLNEVK